MQIIRTIRKEKAGGLRGRRSREEMEACRSEEEEKRLETRRKRAILHPPVATLWGVSCLKQDSVVGLTDSLPHKLDLQIPRHPLFNHRATSLILSTPISGYLFMTKNNGIDYLFSFCFVRFSRSFPVVSMRCFNCSKGMSVPSRHYEHTIELFHLR